MDSSRAATDQGEIDKNSENASIVQVGTWFLDLAQFHSFPSTKGWVETDLSKESRSLVISELAAASVS